MDKLGSIIGPLVDAGRDLIGDKPSTPRAPYEKGTLTDALAAEREKVALLHAMLSHLGTSSIDWASVSVDLKDSKGTPLGQEALERKCYELFPELYFGERKEGWVREGREVRVRWEREERERREGEREEGERGREMWGRRREEERERDYRMRERLAERERRAATGDGRETIHDGDYDMVDEANDQ